MATPCPACRQPMAQQRFAHRQQGEVELDLCFGCQGIWFDGLESAQLAPGGIVELFRLIHEHRDTERRPRPGKLHCPRCDDTLLHGLDIAKGGRFNYDRCLQKHGRFTGFAQFMIEKGFVRQLTPAEIEELRRKVGTVRCSGCGAPVDIVRDSACAHCGAPLAILDPAAVESALAAYRQVEVDRVTPTPERLADLILMNEKERLRRQRDRRADRLEGGIELGEGLGDIGDLILSGIDTVAGLLGD